MSIDYICPNPNRWNEIFQDLCRQYEMKIGKKLPSIASERTKAGGPPTPLILSGWVFSTDADKQSRWLETIEWATENNLLEYVSVDEKDKCYHAGYDHTGGLRGEFNEYTESIMTRYHLNEYVTLNEYLKDPLSVIRRLPESKGIYFVIYPYFWPEYDFLEKGTGGFFKGRDPNIPIVLPDIDLNMENDLINWIITKTETLFGNWVEDADILYIGRAGGTFRSGKISNSNLKERIIKLFQFGNGKNVGHWGGRYLWQHSESYDFRVYWYECNDNENPIDLERKLLNEFIIEYKKLPFANLKK